MLDIHGAGRLYYAELFHFYKLLFDGAITDDAVLHSAVAAQLECVNDNLENPKGMTYEDFDKVRDMFRYSWVSECVSQHAILITA